MKFIPYKQTSFLLDLGKKGYANVQNKKNETCLG